MTQENLRVLLVDDERSLREPLAEYLTTNFGFEVHASADGEEALRAVEENQGQYDVALIDYLLLPEPDGVEVMRRIKARYPEIECIIFTGWGTKERQRALEEGAFRYLEKPFDNEELALLVRTAAQQVRIRAISRAILSNRNLNQVLDRIIAATCSLTHADEAIIVLLDVASGTLQPYKTEVDHSPEHQEVIGGFPSQTLSKNILQTGRTISVSETSANDPTMEGAYKKGFRSFVGVPIPGETGNQGVLFGCSAESDHFRVGGNVALIQTLAGQAGLAIANAHSFQQEQAHAQYMEALVRTGQKLTATMSQVEQLVLAWQFVREQLNVSTFLVALYDKTSDTISFPLVYDEGTMKKVDDVYPGESKEAWGITGYVIKTGEEVFWPTPQVKHEVCAKFGIVSRQFGEPCQSCFYFPLRLGSEVIGAISVQAYDSHAFPTALLDACRALGNQLVVALENTRLVTKARTQATDLETLQRLSVDVASSLNPNDVMTRTCQAAVEFFKADHSGLVLFNDNLTEGAVAAEYPPGIGTLGIHIPIQGVPGEERLVSQSEPLVIEDIAEEKDLSLVREILHGRFGIRSILIVPVVSKERCLGSFSLDSIDHKRRFTQQEVELCKMFAAQVAVAIDNARLYEETRRREQLLTALEEASRHIRSEKEPARLEQEIVRLAAELMGCNAACLLINLPYRNELELTVTYGLPQELGGTRVSDCQGLVGKAVQSRSLSMQSEYSTWPEKDVIFAGYDFRSAVAVPLRQEEEVANVLFIADTQDPRKCSPEDVEILKSFAIQASIALQTSRAMTKEQRSLSTLAIIRKANDYIQAADDMDKILHVVLTGVTAGYGLGFNRSALLLLDDPGRALVGRIGIGQFTETQARDAWIEDRRRELDNFDRYVELLEESEIQPTPVNAAIRSLDLPVRVNDQDVFARVVYDQRFALIDACEQDSLPQAFVDAFSPAFPLAIAPLVARGKSIGILVADNKFTRSPITNEALSTLGTFVNTAAIAIHNAQLYQQTRSSQEQLRSYYEASNTIVSSTNLDQVLRDIVERARLTARAHSVGMVLLNEAGQVRKMIVSGAELPTDVSEMVRPNGLSVRVMHSGRPIVIEETDVEQEEINSSGFWHEIKAAMCLPVTLEARQLGVMWFYYRTTRSFSQNEIDAAQLYVNQAAVAYDSARRVEELEQMRRAAEALAQAIQPHQALQQIVESAATVLHADSVAVWSYDNVRDRFIPEELTAYGIADAELTKLRETEPKPGQTADTVMKLGYVSIADMAEPRHDYVGQPTRELLKRIGVCSLQAVSLRVGPERLGVLYANYHQQRAFGEEEETTLKTFASHAALALKTARLMTQLERTKKAAGVIAGAVVQQDLRLTLEEIAQNTREVLDADVVNLYAYDDTTSKFTESGSSISDQIAPHSVRNAGELAASSATYRILNLEVPYYQLVDDNAIGDPVLGGYFVKVEQVRAAIGIQLRANEQKVGVMFVNFRSAHRFTDDEISTVRLFADQAAAAIRNTQLYSQTARLLEQSQLVADISREAATNLEIKQFLESLFTRLTEIFAARQISIFPSLAVYDAANESLITYHTDFYPSDVRPQRVPRNAKGIMAWVVREGAHYYAPDVSIDENYHRLLRGSRSEIAVPVFYSDELLAVLDLESPVLDAFTAEDLELLTTLASQIAVTIHNVQQYADLKQTKGLVGTRTALAWMGMVSAEWMHGVVGDAATIRDTVELLRTELQSETETTRGWFDRIERRLRSILETPIAAPFHPEQGVELVAIVELIKERLRQLGEKERYRSLSIECHSSIDDSVLVRINPQSLRWVLDILVDNAAEAMATSPVKKLTVTINSSSTSLARVDIVNVTVQDSGPGIPPDIRAVLFGEPVEKTKRSKGLGVGLLLAQLMVQTYEGEIYLEDTGPWGTRMVFWLPVEELRKGND